MTTDNPTTTEANELAPIQTALVVAITDAFKKLTNGSLEIADKAKVHNDDLATEILAQLYVVGWRFLPPLSDEARREIADRYVAGLRERLGPPGPRQSRIPRPQRPPFTSADLVLRGPKTTNPGFTEDPAWRDGMGRTEDTDG